MRYLRQSAERGNTEYLLQSVLDTVEDEGADAGLVRPCDGEFSLYSGYRLCLNLERCVIKGSMQGTYAKPLEANAVILETPVFLQQRQRTSLRNRTWRMRGKLQIVPANRVVSDIAYDGKGEILRGGQTIEDSRALGRRDMELGRSMAKI